MAEDGSYTLTFNELMVGWTIDSDGLFHPITEPTPDGPPPATFTDTMPSITNTINVAVAPVPQVAPIPIEYVTATNQESVAQFGAQETPIVVTLLETIADAELLAIYLIRPTPAYWFSTFRVNIGQCSNPQKTTIANLEIGDQITVTKTFPAPATPTSITQYLYVEGIEHDIDWADEHMVIIHCGPGDTWLPFIVADVAAGVVGDTNYGVG